jgi:hypothetical protein
VPRAREAAGGGGNEHRVRPVPGRGKADCPGVRLSREVSDRGCPRRLPPSTRRDVDRVGPRGLLALAVGAAWTARSELEVPAYELFADTEVLRRIATERMLVGLSTLRYRVAARTGRAAHPSKPTPPPRSRRCRVGSSRRPRPR